MNELPPTANKPTPKAGDVWRTRTPGGIVVRARVDERARKSEEWRLLGELGGVERLISTLTVEENDVALTGKKLGDDRCAAAMARLGILRDSAISNRPRQL